MMGLAVRGLREFAVIDDQTQVPPGIIFPPALIGRSNRFRITLKSPEPEEAVQYWMAGSQPLRLAAYYQVSPVLLDPEPLNVRPGRVFTFGVRTIVSGQPKLDFTTSDLTFLVPGEATPRTVEARPAGVPMGAQIVFHGSNLTGDAVDLVIRHVSWTDAEVVDAITWGVTSNGSSVFAGVQPFAGAQPVLPGVYVAAIRITTSTTLPDGTKRSFSSNSNEIPFAVTARIDPPINFVAGVGTVKGTNFDLVALPADLLQVFIGGERLARVAIATAPTAGKFRVLDASTIEFAMPASIASGTVIPIRVVVRGTESGPFWVTAP
jgi:hypothetical protein